MQAIFDDRVLVLTIARNWLRDCKTCMNGVARRDDPGILINLRLAGCRRGRVEKDQFADNHQCLHGVGLPSSRLCYSGVRTNHVVLLAQTDLAGSRSRPRGSAATCPSSTSTTPKVCSGHCGTRTELTSAGYADGEDARKYDQRLRGPVDPRELEIDPQTGMKNYIANGETARFSEAHHLLNSA